MAVWLTYPQKARGTGPSPSVGSTAADAVGVTRDGARRA